jgi:hypothetical protein
MSQVYEFLAASLDAAKAEVAELKHKHELAIARERHLIGQNHILEQQVLALGDQRRCVSSGDVIANALAARNRLRNGFGLPLP